MGGAPENQARRISSSSSKDTERDATVEQREAILTILLWGAFVGVFLFGAHKLYHARFKYQRFITSMHVKATQASRRSSAASDDRESHLRKVSFPEYLTYRASLWFTENKYAVLQILLGMFFLLLMLGVLMYRIVLPGSVGHTLYQVMVWLIAPDGGVTAATSRGAVVGLFTSLGGLVLFALLMTVMGAMFDSYVQDLEDGSSPVLESDHILILGFTTDTIPLVEELCLAHEDCQGTAIVILSPLRKPEVERKLDEADLLNGEKLKGSRVVVRTGFPQKKDDLKFVSADLCAMAIPMPERKEEKELRDAYMLQCLATLRGQSWPTRGKVLVTCALERNLTLFQQCGGDKVEVINVDQFVSSVLVSSSKDKELAAIISTLFSSEGVEFHTTPVPPELHMKTFETVSLYYPQAIIVGVSRGAGLMHGGTKSIQSWSVSDLIAESEDDNFTRVDLIPDPSEIVAMGDTLVMLTEDDTQTQAADKPMPLPAHIVATDRRQYRHKKETILFVGWSCLIGLCLIQIDDQARDDIVVISYAGVPIDQRKLEVSQTLKRYDMDLQHVTLEYYLGVPGSRFQLDGAGFDEHREVDASDVSRGITKDQPGIKWRDISRVVIFAEEDQEAWQSDAICMTSAMQIVDTLKMEEGIEHPPIVCEIRDAESVEAFQRLGIEDYVISSRLPAQVMATMALQPRLKDMLLQLTATGEYDVCIRALSQYVSDDDRPRSASFLDLSKLVSRLDDLLLGWCIRKQVSDRNLGVKSSALKTVLADRAFELNPLDKTLQIDIDANARLVVVTRNSGYSRSLSTRSPRRTAAACMSWRHSNQGV